MMQGTMDGMMGGVWLWIVGGVLLVVFLIIAIVKRK